MSSGLPRSPQNLIQKVPYAASGRPAPHAAGYSGNSQQQPINSPLLSDPDRTTTSQARERGEEAVIVAAQRAVDNGAAFNLSDFSHSRYSSGLWSSSSVRSARLGTPLRSQGDEFSLSASFPSANNKVHPVPIAVAATPADFGTNSSRYPSQKASFLPFFYRECVRLEITLAV